MRDDKLKWSEMKGIMCPDDGNEGMVCIHVG